MFIATNLQLKVQKKKKRIKATKYQFTKNQQARIF